MLDKPGDLAGLLTSLESNDVLFIDEIHRLSPVVEEYLYSAMEDYRIDIMLDKGPSARSIQIDLNPFTLVGATTRSGLLTAPLRARFGINLHLEYYDVQTLAGIVLRSAELLGSPCDTSAAVEVASRSRGTPRIANALLRRVRDFAQVKGDGRIDQSIASYALEALNIDRYGLDYIDNKLLGVIIDKFAGGPVGLNTIATALGEESRRSTSPSSSRRASSSARPAAVRRRTSPTATSGVRRECDQPASSSTRSSRAITKLRTHSYGYLQVSGQGHRALRAE